MKIVDHALLFVLVGSMIVAGACRNDDEPFPRVGEGVSESLVDQSESLVDQDGGQIATPPRAGRVPSPTPPAAAGVDDGIKMPAYAARTLDGRSWSLQREGDVTMLNLWATWCGPCRYEIPALIELQNEYGKDGLQIVGVSIDSSGMEKEIERFGDRMGINYLIVHDPQARLADLLETTIIPTTVLVDRDGKIVWSHQGIVKVDDPEMLEALRHSLGLEAAATTAQL
jgi:thiol-disulfide isomerase/thioredoxin